MSVDIGQAVQEGGKRTLARNGLYFVVIVWVLNVLNGLFGNTIARGVMNQVPSGMGPGGGLGSPVMGPTLGLSPAVAGVLSLLVGLVTAVVGAAALRTFVTDETETIPTEHFTHNLVWMLVNLVVGGIVFAIVVGVGLVLLVIPGLFLLVSLFFWNLYRRRGPELRRGVPEQLGAHEGQPAVALRPRRRRRHRRRGAGSDIRDTTGDNRRRRGPVHRPDRGGIRHRLHHRDRGEDLRAAQERPAR